MVSMAIVEPLRSLTKALTEGVFPILAIGSILLISLVLMSRATQGSEQFDNLYLTLIGINVLGLLVLLTRLVWSLWKLLAQIHQRRPGARLTGRMVLLFVVLAVTPVVVVYWFSLQFLQHGIDSWFDVRVEQALNDSLTLSRTAFEVRMRESMKTTEKIATEVMDLDNEQAVRKLDMLRIRTGARELALLKPNGVILGSSSEDPTAIVPDQPDDTILAQLRQGENYIGLDPLERYGINIRVVINVPADVVTTERRILQALFPVSDRINHLATNVQSAFARYRKLIYLREELKLSFILTLSLVLLISVFTTVWAAFYSASRLVAPLKNLIDATRAVAAGDYETRLAPVRGGDEVSFLAASFNEMTERLQIARDQAYASQCMVEQQRKYLETVLMRLSTGVMTIDPDHRIVAASDAAGSILALSSNDFQGQQLPALAAAHPRIKPFIDRIRSGFTATAGNPSSLADWRDQIILYGRTGRQVLMISGAPLPGSSGQVIVFDDISALIQAQRNAAWSEVAKRLAHEIKNPLTPIQLSAERVRLKFLQRMHGDERATLDRLTRTIVQQVEAMKHMVNAFSDYADMPTMQTQHLQLEVLVRDVAELYVANEAGPMIEVEIPDQLSAIEGDSNRIRQLLHNLIKNAIEATESLADPQVRVVVCEVGDMAHRAVALTVIDNGPGIPSESLDGLFEPYFTSKPKGTGLGLAIVKKIAEEHGGIVYAANAAPNGAMLTVHFPTISGRDDRADRAPLRLAVGDRQPQ